MTKKLRFAALTLMAALCLCACGKGGESVRVERMDSLTVAATAADRFAGVVVSDNAIQVGREMDKSIKELLVKPGDAVKKDQKLFSYDTDALNLTLDKQELEQDRLEADIKNLKSSVTSIKKEIETLKKNKKDTGAKDLELRQVEMELRQAEFEEDVLAADIKHTKQMLKNVHVYSPVEGTVRTVDETSAESYIIIQQSGAYRIKGLLNEMSMNMGVMEGVNVIIYSRLNPEQSWTGVVELVDYENAQQNEYDSMGMVMGGSVSTSSSYPFYVALEDTQGLLLGQHVYIQIAGTELPEGNYLPESYLMDLRVDEAGNSVASVWAVDEEDRLQKRTVILGVYDMATGSYEIILGLNEWDYVADPADPACREDASVILPPPPVETEPTEPSEETQDPTDGTLSGEDPIGNDPIGNDAQEPTASETTEPTEPEETKTGDPVTENPFAGFFGNKG